MGNKGPDSGAVVRLAREYEALCVRGNHEDDLLEAWYRVGKYAGGLDNYRHNTLSQVDPSDIEWLRSQPLLLIFTWLELVGACRAATRRAPGEADVQAPALDARCEEAGAARAMDGPGVSLRREHSLGKGLGRSRARS